MEPIANGLSCKKSSSDLRSKELSELYNLVIWLLFSSFCVILVTKRQARRTKIQLILIEGSGRFNAILVGLGDIWCKLPEMAGTLLAFVKW